MNAPVTSVSLSAADLDARKARASAWFAELRDRIVAAFESVEDDLPADAPMSKQAAGRFVRTPWKRTDHSGADGGGERNGSNGGVHRGTHWLCFRCPRSRHAAPRPFDLEQ